MVVGAGDRGASNSKSSRQSDDLHHIHVVLPDASYSTRQEIQRSPMKIIHTVIDSIALKVLILMLDVYAMGRSPCSMEPLAEETRYASLVARLDADDEIRRAGTSCYPCGHHPSNRRRFLADTGLPLTLQEAFEA
jgi:hypothetical protein